MKYIKVGFIGLYIGMFIGIIIVGIMICYEVKELKKQFRIISAASGVKLVETIDEDTNNVLLFKRAGFCYFGLEIDENGKSITSAVFELGQNARGDISDSETGFPILTVSTDQGAVFILGPGYDLRYSNITKDGKENYVYRDYYFDGQIDFYSIYSDKTDSKSCMAYIDSEWTPVDQIDATTVAVGEDKFVADKNGSWERIPNE